MSKSTFMKQFPKILFAVLLIASFVSCDNNKELKKNLIGTWIYQTLEEGQITKITEYHINPKGKLEEIGYHLNFDSDEDGKSLIVTMKSSISGTWKVKGSDLKINYDFSTLKTEHVETVLTSGEVIQEEERLIRDIEKDLFKYLTDYYMKDNGKAYTNIDIKENIMRVGSEDGQLIFIRNKESE